MSSKLKNPFSWLSGDDYANVIYIFAFLTLMLLFSLTIIDRSLKTEPAPRGIISFELAKDFSSSTEILSSWDSTAKLNAALSLGLDYLFLVVYSFFLALSCYVLSQKIAGFNNWLSGAGIGLAWMQFLAAIFDAIENYALIRLLFGSQQAYLPQAAFYFATIKFILITLGLLYLLIGFLVLYRKKLSVKI